MPPLPIFSKASCIPSAVIGNSSTTGRTSCSAQNRNILSCNALGATTVPWILKPCWIIGNAGKLKSPSATVKGNILASGFNIGMYSSQLGNALVVTMSRSTGSQCSIFFFPAVA